MKITDKIHLLRLDFTIQITPERVLPRFVNSLVIFGKSITVVDSGVHDSCNRIYDYIRKNNRKINEIKTLIISHAHPDHIGSANRIKADTGCRIIAHEKEKNFIEDINLQFSVRPVPGFFNLVKEPVVVDELLQGGETLALDDEVNAAVINTPGHSPGSFCLLFTGDGVLFTADTLPLENDIPTYDNFRELKNSVNLIRQIDGYSVLLSSWTAPLKNRKDIEELIDGGEKYLDSIDNAVKEHYADQEITTMENCSRVIRSIGLPSAFAVPLVDKAFRTHL